MQVRPSADVRRRHQELCEASGRHGQADPGPEPERGRSLPAAQPGHQEEEEELFQEALFCLYALFPQRHPGRREGDQSRSGVSVVKSAFIWDFRPLPQLVFTAEHRANS